MRATGLKLNGRIDDRVAVKIAILGILLIAAVMRFRGIDFGLPALHDPDEPLFMLIGFQMLNNGTLNPGWFGHPGSTTLYMIAIVQVGTYLVGHFLGYFSDPKGFADAIYLNPGIIFLPVRVVIALFGIFSVYLTWKIGKLLAGWRVGLLAAAFLALNPLHIQFSQIIRTDVQATAFMLLGTWFALQYLTSAQVKHLIFSAIWCGVAIVTKWPAVTVLTCPILAIWAVSWERRLDEPITMAIRLSVVVVIVALMAMFIVSPYIFLDYETTLGNLSGEARPAHLSATGHGFLGNLSWYLSSALAPSLGGVGAVFAILGALFTIRNRNAAIVIGSTPLVFILAISAQSITWERWIVPILPYVSLIMAFGLVRASVWLLDGRTAINPLAAMVLGALPVFVNMALASDQDAMERANDTRSAASRWAFANIPAGKSIAVEYLGTDLIAHGWKILFPAGDTGCIDAQAALSGKTQFNRTEKMRGKTLVVNLGTIPANERATCHADYALVMYRDRYVAERALYPVEAAAYDTLFASGKIMAIFKPKRGVAGGPVVYVVKAKPSNEAGFNAAK
jgi:4-amino-4-deoxy-L-arabinose transferase-like glycosyltransferase